MRAKAPVPSSRAKEKVSLGSIDSSPKNPRREIAKANHGKALRAAFVAMANARPEKERTTYSPTRVPSPAGSSALSPASKPRAASASTKSSSPPARSGLSAKDRMKAKVASALRQVPPNNIGNFTRGAGAQASPPAKPAASFSEFNATDWPVGAGRGKAAAFVSSVIGGVAATGWFLFCARASSATRSSTASQEGEGWSNPFGDLQLNAAAAAAAATPPHPSWSTSSRIANGDRDGGGSGWSSKEDGVRVEGRGKTKAGVEVAQQGDAGSVGENGGTGDEGEYEAGVWVGWGGGCAF
ncbi:hypothetical protein Esi_0017_0046 [Ectocarpus siliculosus]|uniref:Uncharacterized protein n=1 Tax=Ectocarpus siliculosus TaxID=2880 RepID=D7FMJ2_ECTSI|nr:hypothetical protein Esi_0017_0046 [Ectocarpus siliculosus]|eukprot:CBJ25889.1 hypothetical protein Esi_0017_0046 [Ectocarpus siliculosus]